MLIDVKVSNFLSYNHEAHLSLNAGKVRRNSNRVYNKRNVRILKCMAVFGPNASGKSNLVKVLHMIRESVINNKVPREYYNRFFKLIPNNANVPSKFEITLLIDGKKYVFGFEALLSKGKFCNEWLYEDCGNDFKKYLYELNNEDGYFKVGNYFKHKKSIDRLNIYGNDCIGSNSLFLSNINEKKSNMYEEFKDLIVLKNIYDWFYFSLKIHFPSNSLDVYPDFIESNIEVISNFLCAFDTGVTKVKYIKESVEKIIDKVPKNLINDIADELTKNNDKYNRAIIVRSHKQFYTFELDEDNNVVVSTIQFTHNVEGINFDMDEESDGTTHLLDLVEILLNTKRSRTYVFDEIERCLHPSLTVKLLELFLSSVVERNNQLIITTHESRILAEDILRNDEIVFVKKDSKGESEIIPLDLMELKTNKKLRSDKKIYQAFFDLENGLDVLPNFKEDILESLSK